MASANLLLFEVPGTLSASVKAQRNGVSDSLVQKFKFVRAEEHAGVLLPRGEGFLVYEVAGLLRSVFQEFETCLEFGWRRSATEEQMVGLVDASRVIALVVDPLG